MRAHSKESEMGSLGQQKEECLVRMDTATCRVLVSGEYNGRLIKIQPTRRK